MQHIVNGIVEFRKNAFEKNKQLFATLANGQSPEVLFITCADSRIDPNLITQSQPGDLFICRNAGNIVPPHVRQAGGVTASIEYAVSVLGVKDVVVCGHTDCGAMKGAISPEGLDELPHVRDWLDNSRAAVECVKAKHGHVSQDELREVTEQNVLLQLQHLRTHPCVASKLYENAIQLHGWVYQIETGEVTCYDDTTNTFIPIEQRYQSMLSA